MSAGGANLAALLERHAATRPDQVAIIDGDQRVTFAELRDLARAASADFEGQGLQAGSKILVFVPMSIDLYVVLLGAWHLGAVPVFVDPGMGRAQIEAAVTLASPDLLVGVPKVRWLRWFSAPLRRVPRLNIVGGRRLARRLRGKSVDAVPVVLTSDAPALLTFTSGTTGRPKGNLRSHGFLLAQHEALQEVLALRPEDVDVPALPIFLLNTLAAGTTAVIPPIGKRVADIDGRAFYELVQKHGVTTLAGSPALFAPLLDHCRSVGLSLPSVRAIFMGGAPVPPTLVAQLTELLPAGDCCVVYGSTEAEPISHIWGREVGEGPAAATAAGAGLCVGVPSPHIRVRLVDDEILVAGPHVSVRYFNDPEAEAELKVRDDAGVIWHRTGDAGRFDERGRLWLLGRHSRILQRPDRRLYPFCVELAVRARPGIAQAALVARADAAVLVVQGAPSAIDNLDAVALGVDRVRAMSEIPTDPRHNAKIDYTALERLLDT